MSKLLIVLSLSLALTGCAMFSGEYTRTAAINPITGEVQTGLFGRVVYETSRKARAVSIMEKNAQAISSLKASEPKTTQCAYLSADQVIELSATGQGEYFRSVGNCQMMAMTGNVVASAMNRPQSEAEAVSRASAAAVQYAEQGLTDRAKAITSFGTAGIISINARKAVESGNEAIRDVGIAAAENGGHTTVGDITVSNSQTSGADSNDGGSSGELGVGGSGSGVASNTKDGDDVIINIGDNNNTSLAEDDAIAQAGGIGLQALEPSANGAVNIDSNIDQQPVVDDLNESELNNDPENGSNNSLF